LREQVRAWLDQTLVTTDGKLDPAAVEPEAKRRRRKLREEARAEAKRHKRSIAEGNHGGAAERREPTGADCKFSKYE